MFRKLAILMAVVFVSSILILCFGTYNTDEIIIAVIDTGIDEKLLNQENILNGFDFVEYDRLPNDETGHGTLMAKIILDIAPDCYIVPVKFLDKKESYTATRPFAILYAIFRGADIINMSFNGDYDILTKWVIAYGNAKGVIFVGSSGNRGAAQVDYPAKYNHVLAIGGIIPNDETYYGNYGNDISFIAPATYLDCNNECVVGTSVSAAYISGVIAYTKQQFPEMSNVEIKRFLDYHSTRVEVIDGYQYPLIDFNKIKDTNRETIRDGAILSSR